MRDLLVFVALLAEGVAGWAASLGPARMTPYAHHARGASVQMLAENPTLEETIRQTISTADVVVYSKSWCPYCAQCKALFDDMEQPYTVVELDQRDDGDALQATLLEVTKQRTVPNVFVKGQHLGGNDDTQRAARSGKLAALLESSSPAGGSTQGITGSVVPTATAGSSASAITAEALSDPISKAFGEILFPGGSNKQIFFGVLQRSIDPASIPSDEERARRREQAARDLTNIDDDERARRKIAGTAMGGFTAALAIGLLATHAPALTRLAIGPCLFLTNGYLKSAKEGL